MALGEGFFVSLQWGGYRIFFVFNIALRLAIDGIATARPPLVWNKRGANDLCFFLVIWGDFFL